MKSLDFQARYCLPLIMAVTVILLFGSPALCKAGSKGPDNASLTFVYIHGFGGEKQSPQFCANMQEFLTSANNTSRVINYRWDSVKVDPLRAGASWVRSQQRADTEAKEFRRRIIDKLEGEKTPYVLVGFSVGSRVILEAIKSTGSPLEHVRGIYFLGSAMTKDTTLEQKSVLPRGMRIINYHSPVRDTVHSVAFNFMSSLPAGGQCGFDDDRVFENRRVSCSHAHKGVGVHIDYSGLAVAIASMEIYKMGIRIPGKMKPNLVTRVGQGSTWWNKVLPVEGTWNNARERIEIEQHNMHHNYFRAVRVSQSGKRYRIARSENLHAILGYLGVASL